MRADGSLVVQQLSIAYEIIDRNVNLVTPVSPVCYLLVTRQAIHRTFVLGQMTKLRLHMVNLFGAVAVGPVVVAAVMGLLGPDTRAEHHRFPGRRGRIAQVAANPLPSGWGEGRVRAALLGKTRPRGMESIHALANSCSNGRR